MYRNTTDILILYPTTLLNSFTGSNIVLCGSLRIFKTSLILLINLYTCLTKGFSFFFFSFFSPWNNLHNVRIIWCLRNLIEFPYIWYVLQVNCKWSHSVMSDSSIPWTVAYQAPLSMGFSRQEYWSGLPLPSPDLPDPGIEPGSPTS